MPKFSFGEYERILIAPLGRAAFDPHVVLVYANAAQVMRLVAAALYQRGGRIHSSFSARLDCADAVIETIHTGRPQVILPCYGDRIYGQTEDHEMAFTVPWSEAELLVEGLRGTHQGGVRYPIPAWLRYTGEFPEKYRQLDTLWDEGRPAESGRAETPPAQRPGRRRASREKRGS